MPRRTAQAEIPMLTIKVPKVECWDEDNEEFVDIDAQELVLEHSLASIAKWESRWHKPFYDHKEKSVDETIDYIRCMTLNEVDDRVYRFLPNSIVDKIFEYMDDSMTGTTFRNRNQGSPSRSIISAEIIYYYMVTFGIPFECENWHLNRLLALIQVCIIKNSAPKKMGRSELRERNAALNAARRARLGTKG